jgi:hypothetical protein
MKKPETLSFLPDAIDELQTLTSLLAEELPGVTFGYIGNVYNGPFIDERLWYVFLPHPGRVGTFEDSVSLGITTALPAAFWRFDEIAAIARRRYHNGSRRA